MHRPTPELSEVYSSSVILRLTTRFASPLLESVPLTLCRRPRRPAEPQGPPGPSRQVGRHRTNHLAATAPQKGRHPCPVSSESTSAPPTPPSPSSRVVSPPSSRTPRAPAPPRLSWPSPSRARSWSAR